MIDADAAVGLFVTVGGATGDSYGSEISPVHRLIPAVLFSDSWAHRHPFISTNRAKRWNDPLDGSSLE